MISQTLSETLSLPHGGRASPMASPMASPRGGRAQPPPPTGPKPSRTGSAAVSTRAGSGPRAGSARRPVSAARQRQRAEELARPASARRSPRRGLDGGLDQAVGGSRSRARAENKLAAAAAAVPVRAKKVLAPEVIEQQIARFTEDNQRRADWREEAEHRRAEAERPAVQAPQVRPASSSTPL